MRFVYFICFLVLFILGVIGLLLPVVPSSPFFIPSLYCLNKVFPGIVRRILSVKFIRKYIPKKVLERLN
ncbi:YbaN family protein [Aquifex pyrophilus]